MIETDCISEAASSICDEERIKKLFQSCDANGDGFIDSHDLLTVCQELSLEDSLDELMLQLGADSQGRISYEQFLERRLALRPEIDALRGPKGVRSIVDNFSDKLDSWEWDSGARDMSPVPKSLVKRSSYTEEQFKERLQIQLDEQAQRYEEQLTELHSVIAELTRKLHQQRTMAIAEEDETSEVCTTNSAQEDSITCPLEVSELDNGEVSDVENKFERTNSPVELPEPTLTTSTHQQQNLSLANAESAEILKTEIENLKLQLVEYQAKLAQANSESGNCNDDKTFVLRQSNEKESLDIKYGHIVPVHRSKNGFGLQQPVAKMAERIKLKRASDKDAETEALSSNLPSAEREALLFSNSCCQSGSDGIQSEKVAIDHEFRRLDAKLEHARSQNSVLALTLSETKAHCDRLVLLCGKYESNAIALRLALGVSDRIIEAYDVLLALLETEISLNRDNPEEALANRSAAETIAKQLLSHLESHQSTDVLLSPWQNNVYPQSDDPEKCWTKEDESKLREHVSRLKGERSNIQGTYVVLESTQVEPVPMRACSSQEARKIDLEMAVLMQELMGLREDKSELISKLFALEKEKSTLEVRQKYIEGQMRAQTATLKNLQGQLKDTESLLAMATQNRANACYSDAEHAQGIELELMQALAREARLKVRLQELVNTLEQVTKNAEARLLEGREIVHDLNHTNSILAETVDRNNKKYQAKFKKMEQQMLTLVDRHAAQVQQMQAKISSLEGPPTPSSETSGNNSVTV